MRTSRFPIVTTRENPAEAEVESHRLMLRAGLLRKVAAGLYTWMPMGLRVLRKVEAIVREEMDAAGAIELLMPAVQPGELWRESGRWEDYGPELLRFKDRRRRDFVFGPTHEEVITHIARNELTSYRQLPINYYQIQTKFRDEIRPRFGIMRAREFLMKDAYSFHIDTASLDATYQKMYAAYNRIFSRLGLTYRVVLADTGAIGGNESHEFHVLADSGEDAIAFSSDGDYAANVELVPCPAAGKRPPPSQQMQTIATAGIVTIEGLADKLNVAAEKCLKALFVKSAEGGITALFLRGDHTLNIAKAAKHPLVASPFEFAEAPQILQAVDCPPGSLGPVELTVPVVVDHAAAAMHDFSCGANREGVHYTGVNWGRDTPEPMTADLRNVENGEPAPNGHGTLQIKRGIEVGHIFKLGDKYSRMMKANVLGEDGKSQTVTMGCYGIGVSRVVAAAIEQNHDECGIVWPSPMAPFQVVITPVHREKPSLVEQTAQRLHDELEAAGVEVLLDDRDVRAGVLFKDADLLGIPWRIVVSERGLKNAQIECKARTGERASMVPLENASAWMAENRLPRPPAASKS